MKTTYSNTNAGNITHKISTNPDLVKILSRREMECLPFIVNGHTAKEIAKRLIISPRTVECHIENIKNKLFCSRKLQIIAKIHELC